MQDLRGLLTLSNSKCIMPAIDRHQLKEIEKMKKLVKAITMIASVFFITSCASKSDSNTNMALHEYGLQELSLVTEIINSDAYQQIYSSRLNEEILKTLRAGDYSKPESIEYLVFPEASELTELMIESSMSDELLNEYKNSFSSELKEYISKQMVSNMVNVCLSRNGIDPVLFYSVVHASKAFVNKDITPENVICIYSYKDTYPLAATFGYGENGSIVATLGVLVVDDYITGGAETIKDQMNSFFKKDVVKIRKAE